jgi:hypothetical protein
MLQRAATPAFDLTAAGSSPGWVIGLLAVLLVLSICVVAFARAGPTGLGTVVRRAGLLLVVALCGWWVLDHVTRADRVAERRSLEGRALDLTARAVAPGSALACLDGIAGDGVEEACEKAVFASPESAAAAVSYVAAQLSILAAASEIAGGGTTVDTTQAALRRALEADRFGIVAHVLSVRDGCTPSRCGAFAMLRDVRRLRANLAERRFDGHVRTYMVGWQQSGGGAQAAAGKTSPENPPAPASTASVGAGPTKPSSDVYFPSSASIPPVNIMTAEPPGRDGTGTSERKANTGPPQGRASGAGSSAARPAAPLPIAPNPPP